MKKEKIKSDYEQAVTNYIFAFTKKQGFEHPEWCSEIDGIYLFADYYLRFAEIKTDIDMNAPKGLIIKWYYDSIDDQERTPERCVPSVNYTNYIKGVRFITD